MSNADWWAKQLSKQAPAPAYRPDPTPPMPQSQQPMTRYEQPQPQSNLRIGSAKQTETCPECNSNNYMAVQNSAPRCYDCGYPISQSGSRYGALTGAKVEGTTKSSIGNDATNNWNPTGIIGRIDG
jgi:ribosomal protein L37AE/L43A